MSGSFSRNRVYDEYLIVQEANHRFANHLALLSGFVRLKATDLARRPVAPTIAGVQLLLESIRAQIEAIARLSRTLALGGARSPVDLGEHLGAICAPLSSLLAGHITMILEASPGCQVKPDRILPLTQIVVEVITNAAKHAYPSGHAGWLLVRSHEDNTGTIVVEIVDDGPGFPDGFDAAKDCGLGFQLIHALAKHLGALIEFESGRTGLRFRLTLPHEVEPFCRAQRLDEIVASRTTVEQGAGEG